MKKLLNILVLFIPGLLYAQQQHSHEFTRIIDFPNVGEFQTISCDLHIHTVFSDGNVWPSIRVMEAVKDSLDVIAMTEHLEYLPHLEDIPHPDRNRSYEVAARAARNSDLLIVNGSEITRDMPPGHSNAVFIRDANALVKEDSIEVFREANRQEAFVFWNHPNWLGQTDDGIARLSELHLYLIKKGWLHGIEVVNDVTYSPEALQIALDHNLTIMGTSDIHGLVDWQFNIPEGGHRPVTLVFCEEKSTNALKDALFAGRTVAFFNNLLIGKSEWLIPLIKECIQVGEVEYIDGKSVARIQLKNVSSADFLLKNQSTYSLHRHADLVRVPPHETVTLEVKTLEAKPRFTLSFEIVNGITAPRQHPIIDWLVEF